MLIDVRPILHIPGKELNFQFELDLSDMEFGGRNPISRPVIVEGAVRNRAEVLYLELTAHTTLDAVCDRWERNSFRRRRFLTAVFWRKSCRTRRMTRSSCWKTARWT